MRPTGTRIALALSLALTVGGLSGCTNDGRAVVAFLLASDQADRWTSVDEPVFRTHLDEICIGCVYETRNAEQDADRQAQQFEEIVDEGAEVVVLNAVDADAAARMISEHPDVTVIAYDRFVEGADHFISVDPSVTGTVMATTALDAVAEKKGSSAAARVLVVEGAAGDANAEAQAESVSAVLAERGATVLATLRPESWDAETAADFVTENADRLDEVDAIIAGNDTQAAGVMAGLESLGIKGPGWPYITGQDAELDAVRRVVRGQQGMTVHKQIARMAEEAAELSVDLMAGDAPGAELIDHRGVPSLILTPAAVTRATIADTVVRGGVWSIDQICEGATAAPCAALGLK